MTRLRRFRTGLVLIAGAALAVRLVALRFPRGWRWTQPLGLSDEFGYSMQARAIAAGDGIVNPFEWWFRHRNVPSAGHPPLYSLFLSVPGVVGLDTPRWNRIATVLLGTAVVVVVGLLARELAGDRAGLLAAGGAALYPQLWASDTAIQPEALYSLLVVTGFLVGYRMWRAPGIRLALLLGATLALAALTRSEGVLLFPLVALPFVLTARGADARARWRMAGAIAAVGLVLIGAWVGRNLATFDRPTFMASGSGHVLAYANCDATYSGRFLGYWADECALKDWPDGDESVVDEAAREKGLTYLRDHERRVPVVVAARVGRLFDVYRPIQNVNFNAFFERRGLWPSRLGLAMYYVLLVPAAYGLLVMRRRGIPISPLVGLVALVAITAATTIGITRYRAPLDAMLPVLAAVGVDALLRRERAETAPDAPATATPTGATVVPTR